MDGTAVKEIASLKQDALIIECDNKKFSPLDLKRVIHDPLPTALNISTLKGIVDFVKHLNEKVLICVESPTKVSVKSALNSETMSRKNYLVSQISETVEFAFGRFIDNEEFIIQAKSRLKETEDQKELLSFVSKVTAGTSITAQDDGCSQSVEVKTAVSGALRQKKTAPSVVKLAPYRTFREVEQPESEFIFRMKSRDAESLPTCALFEADGGAWRIKAIENVAKWLQENLSDQTVIS